MNSVASQPGESANRLVGLFHELLDGLPPETATIGFKRTRNDDGALVWLKPSGQQAAEFSAHIDDEHTSLIDVSFGSGSTFELPCEAKLPSDATFEMVLGVVRDLALAVVAGRCEERFGFLGVRGTIRVDETNVFRCTHFFYPRLFPKTIHYLPYSSGPRSSSC